MTTDNASPSSAETSDFYDIANQLVVELWDENFHHGYWLSDQDDSSNRVAADRLTDLLIEKSDLAGGGRVLDVGCGVGLPAFRLAGSTPAHVVGISNNQSQIDEANRRAAEKGLSHRVSFEFADALKLPYADDSFDVVWALETLPHLDRLAAYAEMRRVLKPGGLAVITDLLLTAPLSQKSQQLVDEFMADMSGSPRLLLEEYRELVGETGLELVELLDVSAHTSRTGRRVTEAVNERFDEMVGRYGQEITQLLEVFRSPVGMLPEMGYLVAVARNPA